MSFFFKYIYQSVSSYSFLTLALGGGEWSVSVTSQVLAPGKGPQVPIGQEAGWAPEPGCSKSYMM
jgi:hypothetical protein